MVVSVLPLPPYTFQVSFDVVPLFTNIPVDVWDRIASDCLRNDSSLTDCSLQLCKEVGAHSSKLLPYIEPLILIVQTFFIICHVPFYVV